MVRVTAPSLEQPWSGVDVANLRGTRRAWDVGDALAEVLTFDREIVVDWDHPQDWFTQDYCRVVQPRPGDA